MRWVGHVARTGKNEIYINMNTTQNPKRKEYF